MAKPKYSSPKGIKDILAPESGARRALLDLFSQEAWLAGYGEIVLPMFEEVGVFSRVGESTEIVQKQMYDFYDKDERHIVLRPESTASVMRAFIEHRPTLPWKCWYEGAHFRYEKPQAGRFRQFHQVGIELLGAEDPVADAEVIALGWGFLNKAGAKIKLLINSLGDAASREKYVAELGKYLESHLSDLSDSAKTTLKLNPLRVLDSKIPTDMKVTSEAPEMKKFLSTQDTDHFQEVCENLKNLGIEYELAPRLVRGLDYYTRTAFEYVSVDLDIAHDALGGGGRYDGLSESLGGPECVGVGFAIGIDRTLLAIKEKISSEIATKSLDVFIADLVGDSALMIAMELRSVGISTDYSFGRRSLKAQMKQADRSGAQVALIIGEEELEKDSVSLVELRKSEGEMREKSEQDLILRSELTSEIRKYLNK